MKLMLIRGSVRALKAQHKRSLLAAVGVIIGVCALVVMIAVGEGGKRKVLREFESMGKNLLVVSAGEVSVRGGRIVQRETATTLTREDALAISDRAVGVTRVAPIYDAFALVERGREVIRTKITGTTPDYPWVRNFFSSRGRFFTDEEMRGRVRVAVLGLSVAQALFGDVDPVGQDIRIRRIPFRVIGIMEPKGVDASGEDQDDQILIPITTATMRVFHVTYIKGILVQAQDEKLMSEVARSIRCLLHGRHKLGKREDDFSVNSMEEIMREKARAASIFAVLVAAVAAVSLLVGAVGVLAVMLLSVRERVQEIGVRRAVGASQADVLFQFMVESLMLTLLGGGMGLVLGVSFSALASLLLGWELVLPIRSALVGIVVSVFTGVVAGLYPAYKASLIHPIQALRL